MDLSSIDLNTFSVTDFAHAIPGYVGRLFTQPPWDNLAWPVAAMAVGTAIGMLAPKVASQLALTPRTGSGLVGIVTAPFIHTGPSHFLANLPPFVVLGALVLRHGEYRFREVALAIALAQGILLWMCGRKAAHVGMSGVIFGFFGYLLALWWFTRISSDLLVGGGVLVFYGGMLAGVAPARDGSSWEGHLLGLVAGVGVAWCQYHM